MDRQESTSTRSPSDTVPPKDSSHNGKFSGVPDSALAFLIAASSWAAVLLVINRALFRLKLIETGDLATILFQVRDAERFRELLGNYSRWRFHHPGPDLCMSWLLGDFVFRRCLHHLSRTRQRGVPDHAAFNVALLFAAIWIFRRACTSRLFLPAAMIAALWLTYVINRTLSPVATVDVWFPHMLLYVFLLFFALCASVGTGSIKDLPVLLVCAGLVVHGHVAQVLFVSVLLACSLVGLYLSRHTPRRLHYFPLAAP